MLKPFLAVLLTFCFSAVFGAGADITQVRVVGDGAPTRITAWSDVAEPGEAFLVETDGVRRIVIPLGLNAYSAEGFGTGGVESWQVRPGRLEFVLDRPMQVARLLRLPPTGAERQHRLILDLDTVSEARFSQAASRDVRRLAAAEARPAPAARPVQQAAARPATPARPASGRGHVVVIDPGHGGRDPGALAINGGVEKEITLKAALELKRLLEADGRYQVRLTRETDVYVDHEDRVTMARNWGAELFISLHADAAGSPNVAGASVYTISARGEGRVDREARRNNWVIPIEDGTPDRVTGILTDLVKRETRTRSAEFAELLLPELERAGPVLRNTHRNAGFYVLLAPDVPAVLLELGFLTNAADARRLQSDAGRRAATEAIKRAIDAYFERQDVRLAAQ
ncbi:N-acetylmuramoyl-L-alanine amidase [Hyphomonas sp.]|uniref:N-acetylmuramoyl-L-alanine amidase family protein n=1 Tax=Hyphomonas sp. TaxID=87 RepID=UPI00391C7366